MDRILSNKYLIYLIIFASFAIRIINIGSDTPYFVQTNYIVDEGGWLNNARHFYLNNEWISNTHDAPFYMAPGFSFILYIFLKLFGLSIYPGRYISAFAGTITVILLWLFLLKNGNIRTANIGSIILAFSGFHVLYSRLVNAEIILTMLLMLTLLLWSFKKHRLFAVLAGMIFSLMFIIKISNIYFIPVLGFLFIIELVRKEISFADIIAFILGNVFVLIFYIIYFVRPNWEEFVHWNYIFPSTYMEGITYKFFFELFFINIFNNNPFQYFNKVFSSIPILSIFGYFILMGFVIDIGNNWKSGIKKISYAEIVGISIILGNLALLAVSSYKPERRYIPILLGICLLVSGGIGQKIRKASEYARNYKASGIRNIITNGIIIIPVFVFICQLFYSLWGDWEWLNIGMKKGFSLNAQIFIFFPIFVALLIGGSIFERRRTKRGIIWLVGGLIFSEMVGCWIYYMVLYFNYQLTLSERLIIPAAIWIIGIYLWKNVNNKIIEEVFQYSILLFIISQGIIIGYIHINPTYTYRDMGREINEITKNKPIITVVSYPVIKHSGEILYGLPSKMIKKINSKTAYIINIEREGNYHYGRREFTIFGERENISENAENIESFDVMPFGTKKKSNLRIDLWKINNKK